MPIGKDGKFINPGKKPKKPEENDISRAEQRRRDRKLGRWFGARNWIHGTAGRDVEVEVGATVREMLELLRNPLFYRALVVMGIFVALVVYLFNVFVDEDWLIEAIAN